MIDEITLSNVALIRTASLEPAEGLTVVTGESGAGKTALLSAISLLMGARADADVVSQGAERAEVAGRFYPHASGSGDFYEMVATRTVLSGGRSRASIDGSMCPVRDLASGPGATVDLCGQHEHQNLLHRTNQRTLLDIWAGQTVSDCLNTYHACFDKARLAQHEYEHTLSVTSSGAGRVDDARFVLRSIAEVNPEDGEYERLLSDVALAENAELFARAVEDAREALNGDGGVLEGLDRAAGALESLAEVDAALAGRAADLREAGFVVEDIVRDVSARDGAEDMDAAHLERLQERIASFQGLMRRYGPTMTDVFTAADEARVLVEAYDGRDDALARAKALTDRAEEALYQAAVALDEARRSAAPRFCEQVREILARLEMGDARIEIAFEELPRDSWTRDGSVKVEFLFSAGHALASRPLTRIASGGELSRVMLAMKVVLGAGDQVDTLVFDEVDAGVGGSAARAVADVLCDLSKTHQVIVVTHLPQIAVAGDVHYRVSKCIQDGIPVSALERLDTSGRIDEVARMLSGDASKAAREHAEQMLTAAGHC